LQIAGPAFGQKPAANSTSPAIKVTTHLVVLTVVVTDKKGNPVTNLGKDDFKILENGHPERLARLSLPLS